MQRMVLATAHRSCRRVAYSPYRKPRSCATREWLGELSKAAATKMVHIIIAFISSPRTIGAGAGLSWVVWIGGQRSVAPSTNYGPPIISGFAGKVADASTNGGDSVTILGSYFSVQAGSASRATKMITSVSIFFFVKSPRRVSWGPLLTVRLVMSILRPTARLRPRTPLSHVSTYPARVVSCIGS
jgi:hypothetical protein